jgi:hypothetical protein
MNRAHTVRTALLRLALVSAVCAGLALATGAAHAQAYQRQPIPPYEYPAQGVEVTELDELVAAGLRQHGVSATYPCSDEVFVRRVYLDVTGTLPEPEAVEAFLSDTTSDKRAALIDELLESDDYVDFWTLRWCDVLRVKSEFPINLWPNGVQAYHRWIHEAVRDNMPYDEFARQMLTASGSNFRVPQVNFYRAIQGTEPRSIAAAVALTFMGSRLEGWDADRQAGMEQLFSRVAYKRTDEWKEEIVLLDPAPAQAFDALLPDGTQVTIEPHQDPRAVFADWLIQPDNEWFAPAVVNRIWAWLLGRGLVHESDDMGPHNPPLYPDVLAYLSLELSDADWDLKRVMRLILNSAVYQQSALPVSTHEDVEALFACYPVRPLEAEVLQDALVQLGAQPPSYESAIPEPFTHVPESNRTIALADGSITSQFLEIFGRPTRDTGRMSERGTEPSDAQRLYLLNSTDVHNLVQRSRVFLDILLEHEGDPLGAVDAAYLTLLSRHPTQAELQAIAAQFQAREGRPQPKKALEDIAWALLNSKEFLYHH